MVSKIHTNLPHEAIKDKKGIQTEMEQAEEWTLQACWLTAQASQGAGKVHKLIQRSSLFLKETAYMVWLHGVHWSSVSRTNLGGFLCKRWPPFLKTVQPAWSPVWQWRWKQSHMPITLECFWWQSDHACHHPNRFNELATKAETCWNEGKWLSR